MTTTTKKNHKKDHILYVYSNLHKKLKKNITYNDIVDNSNYTKNMIKHYWGSLKLLDEAARTKFDTKFQDENIEKIISPKKIAKLRSSISKYKKFFITTAVTGCRYHNEFYNTIKQWEKTESGKMLILISSDPAHNLDKNNLGRIDKMLTGEDLIIEDTELNSNIFLSTIKLSAKQIDPITGMNRIGQRNGSLIFASPKQRLKPVPIHNNKLPHFLMTTGAITKPDYSSTNFMSNRTAYIAENDHVIGGIIVEIIDEDRFHFRQVQADKQGRFIDNGVRYSPDGNHSNVKAEAIVVEWHSGETDPECKKALEEIAGIVTPKYIVVHDIFNGASINHHEDNNIIYKSKVHKYNLSLENELKFLANDLVFLSSLASAGSVVVKSNHDEWLEQYLKQGKYIKDPLNHGISLKIADKLVNDNEQDPLRWAIENLTNIDKKTKIRWLSRDEDFKISGIQLGAHGDKGANGARGSLLSIENAYGDSITGHAHSPEILRGAWQIGTLSYLELEYNKGPSSWLNSLCVVYPNGARQFINIINGEWC